jgi:cytochrome c peroxidase
MRVLRTLGLFTGLISAVVFARAEDQKQAFKLPAEIPTPANNRQTPERVELGKLLFFDPRLSGSNSMSCASCHNPSLGWSDGRRTAMGNGMRVLGRATPSILNSAYNDILMWDGRFHTLEEQALDPILAPSEMNGSIEQILEKLNRSPEYKERFNKAYPGEGLTKETIAKAISTYERTIVSRNSPFDRWIVGDEGAVRPSVKRGFALFVGKAHCVACHQGPNFTDQGFHNIGLKGNQDEGRFARVPINALKGAFKTPALRNIALTGPYMHNGVYRTLADVVEHYNRGGDLHSVYPNVDPNIKPLHLTAREKNDLVRFLESLTGEQELVELPKLPQ